MEGNAHHRWWSRLRPDMRWLVYAAIAAVAAFSFIVSYSHIYDLGREHHQDGTAARLLPLSVDLLIVMASLVLFIQHREDARPKGLALWLPRATLYAAIGATVAANVFYGLPYGVLAAVISGWPGAAFVAAVEVGMVIARPAPKRVTPRVTAWKPDPITKITAAERCSPKTAQLVQRRERAAVKAASNGHGPHG